MTVAGTPAAVNGEKPLPVSASCATAILEGRKSMVRYIAGEGSSHCPFASPGDRLWVAEPWALLNGTALHQAVSRDSDVVWQPARTMPSEMARSWVQIESTKLEHLADISLRDIAAEGSLWVDEQLGCDSPEQGFAQWWDLLHRRPGTRWSDNPLVWVVAFHKTAP